MITNVAVEARRKRRSRHEDEVPASLRRLWGLSTSSRLGRPAELDLQQVLRSAVELADRGGLAKVTLPRIAKALGYTAMSLYRHVGSKDELLMLMRDFASGPPPAITSPPEAWRAGLREWARAERRLYQRRPWLARVPISGPPAGPNQIAWMETALRILRGTGLDWAQKVGILTLVSGYVRNATLLSQELAHGRERAGIDQAQSEERYGSSLAKLVDPARFPEMARLFASGLFQAPVGPASDDSAKDPDFSFGLEQTLDGVAAAVGRTRRRPAR